MTLRIAKIILFFTTTVLIFVSLVAVAAFVGEARNRAENSGNSGNEASNGVEGQAEFLSDGSAEAEVPDFAFKELTIPYLRGRDYQSSLGGLAEVSRNGGYTAYLTSYDSDGFRVNGLLTIPDGAEPAGGWPALVFVHGYIPPTQYRTLQRYEDHVDYLARSGLVVFKIDLRGHGSSEGSPNGAYYSGDYVVDTLNARAALQATDFVNADKIALWGHSMAGNVVLRSFVAAQDVPAIVVWAGAVFTYDDMRQFGIEDNSYSPPAEYSERQRERRRLMETYGNFNAESQFWSQVVPTNYLAGLPGAIQLHHALDDQVTSIEYSRNLSLILEEKSVEHEFYEYSDGGHNLNGSAFTSAMQRTVDFLKRELSY